MKQLLLLSFVMIGISVKGQTLLQSVNSGSVIGTSGSVSIGEIVVQPVDQSQPSSGIIGILAQVTQPLEVPQLELSEKITVFPNPTTAMIYFQTETNLSDEKISIFNLSGQLISEKKVTADNALDLSELATGIYLIQFTNKNVKSFKIIKR